MLNLALMKEPMNWFIVFLMALLGSMLVRYVMQSASASTGDGDS